MNISSFFKHTFFVFAAVLLISCDEEANEIGANIVSDDNFIGEPKTYDDILAYTQPMSGDYTHLLGGVETNNIKSDANGAQQLGIYNNPVFGKTTAHVVTEVRLPSNDPVDFSRNPQIVSAVLSIPYFSHVTGTNATTGRAEFDLDSIYGAPEGKLDLGIYESLFYIKPDPAIPGQPAANYSNQLSLFTKGPKLNTSSTPAQNTQFFFSDLEQKESTENELGEVSDVYVGPRMQIDLDPAILGPKLFGPDAVGKLVNNNIFTNYFRGLHFSVAQSGSSAAPMAMMNFNGGKIVVKYTQNTSATDTDQVVKYLTLSLNGNNVNLFDNQFTPAYNSVLTTAPNITEGSKKLYLKGGEGSMAVIELFKTKAIFEAWKAEVKGKMLVNDASLVFTVDETLMAGAVDRPNRIYLYDLNNNKPLIDYSTDQSNSLSNKYNKGVHGGILKTVYDPVTNTTSTQYKIRITNFIRSLVSNDNAQNVRLGLVVTENINTTSNKTLQTAINLPDNPTFGQGKKIEGVPTMSIANPFGTILYGSNFLPGDEGYEKRLKFTIYYTKPN